jgi:hypothetical protein
MNFLKWYIANNAYKIIMITAFIVCSILLALIPYIGIMPWLIACLSIIIFNFGSLFISHLRNSRERYLKEIDSVANTLKGVK